MATVQRTHRCVLRGSLVRSSVSSRIIMPPELTPAGTGQIHRWRHEFAAWRPPSGSNAIVWCTADGKLTSGAEWWLREAESNRVFRQAPRLRRDGGAPPDAAVEAGPGWLLAGPYADPYAAPPLEVLTRLATTPNTSTPMRLTHVRQFEG